MIIYADVLFLVNFAADFLAIYISAKILNVKTSYPLFALSALIGGIYGVAAVYIKNTVYKWGAGIAVMIIMCLAAFRKKTVKDNLKANFVFVSVNMLLAGIMSFIYETAYEYKIHKKTNINIKPVAAAVFFIVSFAVIRIFQKILKKRAQNEVITGSVRISDKKIQLNFLCDTGNVFKDAYTDLPVIVVSCGRIKDKIDFEKIFREIKSDADTAVKYKFRYVSLSTVAGNTVMPAIVPDKTEVQKDGNMYEIKAIVAFDNSSEKGYDGNDGIIPYSVLQI